jgi:sorbose reductase
MGRNIIDKFHLDGKIAIIAGASRGIGKAVAEAYSQAGATIAIFGRKFETLKNTASEISKASGNEVYPVVADVSNEDSVVAAVDEVVQKFGTVDVLVNNAGYCQDGLPAEELTTNMFKELFDINVMGAFVASKACSKYMIPKRSGSIVNTTSMSAHICNKPQTTTQYAVSKAALVAPTKNLAAEWGKYNVRVNCVSPGYHKTELLCTWEDMFETYESMVPMERLGIPEELAGAYLFFASDASSYTTGCDLISDGGYMLW